MGLTFSSFALLLVAGAPMVFVLGVAAALTLALATDVLGSTRQAAARFSSCSWLAHMIQPQFIHRHRWQPGDVLMSDNRCSLHRASEWDENPYSRRLHRIIMLDDRRPQ